MTFDRGDLESVAGGLAGQPHADGGVFRRCSQRHRAGQRQSGCDPVEPIRAAAQPKLPAVG